MDTLNNNEPEMETKVNQENQKAEEAVQAEDSAAQTESTNTETEAKPEETTSSDDLLKAQEQAKNWEKKYLYLVAESENFKKRMQKERSDFIKFGHEGLLRELLMVQDNFERALMHAKNSQNEEKIPALDNLVQGIEMIKEQFAQCLFNNGVSEVKSLGEKFDPRFHEAVAEQETNEAEPNTVMEEHQKGYSLHGRLLRAARVVTAKKKTNNKENE